MPNYRLLPGYAFPFANHVGRKRACRRIISRAADRIDEPPTELQGESASDADAEFLDERSNRRGGGRIFENRRPIGAKKLENRKIERLLKIIAPLSARGYPALLLATSYAALAGGDPHRPIRRGGGA